MHCWTPSVWNTLKRFHSSPWILLKLMSWTTFLQSWQPTEFAVRSVVCKSTFVFGAAQLTLLQFDRFSICAPVKVMESEPLDVVVHLSTGWNCDLKMTLITSESTHFIGFMIFEFVDFIWSCTDFCFSSSLIFIATKIFIPITPYFKRLWAIGKDKYHWRLWVHYSWQILKKNFEELLCIL